MAREMSSHHLPLTIHTTHNMRIRMRLEGPTYIGCRFVLNMLLQSPLGFALSTYIWLYPTIFQRFWWNAETVVQGTKSWIKSTVLGKEIILSEDTIRTVLQLNEEDIVTFFKREDLDQTLKDMGYDLPYRSRGIRKCGFIPPWQFLVTQLAVYFTTKYGHYNDISYKLMEIAHAVVHETSYNFSVYLMRDFEKNMHCVQPFTVYPRFLMKVIRSQLDFGGIPNWYPRADLVLQENIREVALIPIQNHTRHTTYLWIFVTLFFRD